MKQVTKIVIALLLLSGIARAQQWDWGKREYINSSDVNFTDIATDASGNIFHSAYITGVPVLPNGIVMKGAPANGGSSTQGMTVKITPDGTYQWATRLNADNSLNWCINTFSNGNVGVTGLNLASDLTFNGVTYPVSTPAYLYNYFLTYDTDGNELSSVVFKIKPAPNTVTATTNAPAIATAGDKVYLCFNAYDTIWYNNTFIAMPAGQKKGIFCFVLNASGQVEKVMRLGAITGNNDRFKVAANAAGEVFISCVFPGSLNAGNGVSFTTADNYLRFFNIKFDSDGTALWMQHSDTDGSSASNAGLDADYRSILDDQGYLYVFSGFVNTIIFNGQTYSTINSSTQNSFVLKIDPHGNLIWVKQFNKTVASATDDSRIGGLVYNNKGFLYGAAGTTCNVYFGDIFKDDVDLYGDDGATKLLYLLKMDTTGVVNTVRFFQANGVEQQYVLGLTFYGDKVYVGGHALQDFVLFDNDPTLYIGTTGPSQYRYDTYVASFTDCNAQITRSGSQLTASSGVSYQWYFNGGAIGSATNQNYNATLSGNYTVNVTFAGGCSSRSATLPLNLNTTATQSAQGTSSALSLYPNPSSGKITLQLNQPGNGDKVNVTFYNQQGSMMMSSEYPNWADQAEYVVDVAAFPQGMYYAKVSCGDQQSGLMFVKQ